MERPHRKRMRLPDYDYASDGYYFVTVCTKEKRCVLAAVVGEGLAPPEIRLFPAGQVVQQQVAQLHQRFPLVTVDKYVIMPNHIHVIFRLSAGGASPSPTPSLWTILGAFKSLSTRMWNQMRGVAGEQLWQRSYYDHIIANEKDYLRIWQYIDENPAKWREDRYYQPW